MWIERATARPRKNVSSIFSLLHRLMHLSSSHACFANRKNPCPLETKLSLISPKNAPLISYCVFLQMIIQLFRPRAAQSGAIFVLREAVFALCVSVTHLMLSLHSRYNVSDEPVWLLPITFQDLRERWIKTTALNDHQQDDNVSCSPFSTTFK